MILFISKKDVEANKNRVKFLYLDKQFCHVNFNDSCSIYFDQRRYSNSGWSGDFYVSSKNKGSKQDKYFILAALLKVDNVTHQAELYLK